MASASADLEALVAWLQDHDETCPVCRYSLRGVARARCPECGAGLRLAVASPNAALGPWSLAVISFTLALGFDGVTLLLFGTAATIQIAGAPLATAALIPQMLLFISPLLVLGAACIGGLWWFFARRRTWALVDRKRQWVIAGTIFFGVGVFHAVGGVVMAALASI